jgi:hypothetical protein
MWNQAFSVEERVRRYLDLARRAEVEGAFDLARIYWRMARDLAPAPARRRSS